MEKGRGQCVSRSYQNSTNGAVCNQLIDSGREMGNVLGHGIINYIDTKAKCRHIKKSTSNGTLRQVYQSLWIGDTVSHVGIFDPAV